MSKASDAFENEIVQMLNHHIGESLPANKPLKTLAGQTESKPAIFTGH